MSSRYSKVLLVAFALVLVPGTSVSRPQSQSQSQQEPHGGDRSADENAEQDDRKKDSWAVLGAERRADIERFADDYVAYLKKVRGELLAVEETARLARGAGFDEWSRGARPKPGQGYFAVNRGRAILLFRAGKRPLDDGLRMVASHIDSPRLDVKGRPLYEKHDFALMQTLPHGGIKNYQWGNIPLALVGHFDRIDGTRQTVAIGLDQDDPVFLIPDLAPHVDRPRRDRKSRDVLKGEELDPIIGSMNDGDGVEKQILAVLEQRFGVDEDDFVSAELSFVPALAPREVGLDRGLILAYGQDDQLCSFAALRALLDERIPELWSAVYLTDNEESGSNNNTGAKSEFLKLVVSELLAADGGFDELRLRRVFARTVVASADVTSGVNPLDASVHELGNAARINGGVIIKRYGRGNDANSEILALVRRILHQDGLPWQTHTYKVGVGGGGTLGGFLSVMGMDVVDVGAPILSAHSPGELSSKADVYALYMFLASFLMSASPAP